MGTMHTPGPWRARETDNIHDQGLVVSEATGANVAVTYQGRADARLCAAAPKLLAALQAMCDVLYEARKYIPLDDDRGFEVYTEAGRVKALAHEALEEAYHG